MHVAFDGAWHLLMVSLQPPHMTEETRIGPQVKQKIYGYLSRYPKPH